MPKVPVVSASLRKPRVPDPKPRPTISREKVRVLAHQMVDGLAGTHPVVYFALNQKGDIPTLTVFLESWLSDQGVDIK